MTLSSCTNAPLRFIRRMALLGGVGLILHYALHLLHGLQTGRVLWDDMNTPLGRIDGVLFTGAFIAIDIALLGIYSVLRQRPREPIWLCIAGAIFALVAIGAEAVGLIGFLVKHMVPFAFAVGCLSMFVSALLLGIAGLLPGQTAADQTLPRRASLLMIVFALTTAPLGFAFETLKAVVPVYIVFEVHFVVAAVIWLAIRNICLREKTEDFPARDCAIIRA